MTEAYEIIQHSQGVVIVGAGGADKRAARGAFATLVHEVATIPPEERVH
jgi:hypothetical protein